jgi:hypothetical protein
MVKILTDALLALMEAADLPKRQIYGDKPMAPLPPGTNRLARRAVKARLR